MEQPIPFCPYVGLEPFAETDKAYFFGREQDQETIAANLLTAKLTILYGESGVGKSSVLRAGVLPILRQIPNLSTVYFRRWQDDTFAATLHASILRDVNLAPPDSTDPDVPLPLDEFLSGVITQTKGSLAIILDQFEEYFLYHPNLNDSFDAELARAVNNTDLRVNFLIALREDALAKIDRFEGRIPHLYSNYLRLDYLGRAGAERAIRNPLQVYNAARPSEPPVRIEDELVNTLIDQVQTGKVTITNDDENKALATATIPAPEVERVEAPFLQMILTRLWAEEMGNGGTNAASAPTTIPPATTGRGEIVLKLATLNRLGGAQKIVSTHLDSLINQLKPAAQAICAEIFDHLVTPSRTKIAQTSVDLITIANKPEAQVTPVLDRLEEGRILRRIAPPMSQPGVIRYEIFHDVLAPALLDWRRRYRDKSKVRRLVALAVVAAAILLVLGVLTISAFQAALAARASELAANAIVNLDIDPERTILLGLESLELKSTVQGEDALRRGLAGSLTTQRFSEHRQSIYGVAVSPDGTRALSTDVGGSVFIWDPQNGQVIHELKGETDLVWGGGFSPDGKRVVTAGQDGSAIVWDAETGQQITALKGHKSAVLWATFSPDGERIATAGQDRTAIVWDATSYKQLAQCTGAGSDMTHVAFSPDSTLLLASSKDGTARIWDVHCQAQENEFDSPASNAAGRQFWSAEFSPNQKRVVTAGADGNVRVWEISSGNELLTMAHKSVVSSAVYSPDGTKILSASWDLTARVWDAATGRELQVLAGDTDVVHSAAFFMDNHRIITGSFDKVARIWDLERGGEFKTLKAHTGVVWTAFPNPDDTRIVSAGEDGAIIIWDASTAHPISAIRAITASISSAVFSPDGTRVLAASRDKTARVFDVQTGAELLKLLHPEIVTAALYSPDGKYIATASRDDKARLWNAQTGELVRTFEGHTGDVYALGWSADSKYLATGGYDYSAIIWDIAQDKPVIQIKDTVSARAISTDRNCCIIFGIAISPDGKSFATVGDSHLVRIWDFKTGKLIRDLNGHTDRIYSVFYSADGKQIISTGVDETVRIWDANNGDLLHTLRGFSGYFTNAVFSNNGRYVIASSSDKTIHIYAMNPQDLIQSAHDRLTRDLTCEERHTYLHEGPCPTPTPVAK